MKKSYNKPTMTVVTIQHKCTILSGSSVTSIGGNVFDGTPTGGSGEARSRFLDDWTEE